MKYVIASASVTDQIYLATGEQLSLVAGGAGTYALCGAKLWDDDVLLVTGVGADYINMYGDWFVRNNLSIDGLVIKDEKTPHTVIHYFDNGEREETPLYGAKHFKEMEVTPHELEPYFNSARGIYIFRNAEESFWERIISLKKDSDTVLMWEIASDATYSQNLEAIKTIVKDVDIFSINLTEAKLLFGCDDLNYIVNEFISWPVDLIFLRRGSKGSIMITDDEVVMVPAEKNIKVVDPTGGGNSSSAAVLCGFCEGKNPVECALMGNLSAVMCLSQFGPPKLITKEMQRDARKRIEEFNAK